MIMPLVYSDAKREQKVDLNGYQLCMACFTNTLFYIFNEFRSRSQFTVGIEHFLSVAFGCYGNQGYSIYSRTAWLCLDLRERLDKQRFILLALLSYNILNTFICLTQFDSNRPANAWSTYAI